MGVVVFDASAFKVRYSEFAATSDLLLAAFFDEATLVLNNTDNSRVTDLVERKILLWLLTAHIAAINNMQSGNVGRLSSATQGSVSVSMQYNSSEYAQWYDQTKYGAEYWAMTAKYRTMQYRVGMSNSAKRYTMPGYIYVRT